MTITNLTASIAGTIYPVLNTTYSLDDKVDERSTVRLTIYDANGAYSFQFGQPVTISDTLEGIKFTGFVAKPAVVKYNANAALAWQLDCVDNQFLAGKKTSNRIITNQYAGVAAVSMVNDHLSQDGVVANYAIRDDNSLTEFAQGTLAGTIATSNLGGDLELALAGSTVTITENTTSVFGSGSLTNMSASSNTLGPSSTSAMKIQATQSVAGISNSYTYVKIWSGSITVVVGRYLTYDLWISSSSPQAQIAIDMVFTDGTTMRDGAISNSGLYFDAQNKSPHPGTDLAGLAVDTWYHRSFLMDHFNGKTISYMSIAIEGDNAGTYTGYVKNVTWLDSGGGNHGTFFSGSLNVNPPQQMQKQGYQTTKVTVVNTYDCSTAQRVSPSYSIDLAKILKSSFLTYKTTLPTGYTFNLSYSIDGGNSYTLITGASNSNSTPITANNVSLPNMLAGQSIAGMSIQFLVSFTQGAGADPTQKPLLNSMQALLYPSYTASKNDINGEWTTNGQWNTAGTSFNSTQAPSNILEPFGAVRNWDDGVLSSQTLFGGGATGINNNSSCWQYVDSKQFRIFVFNSTEARSRMDFAGQWQNFQMEFDMYIDNTLMKPGCVYRTTNWSNYDANYAYCVQFFGTTVNLSKGSNSSAASTGTQTILATATITLTTQVIHRIKVIVNGTSHQVYIDDVLAINTTDATYTAAGYVGLRVTNTDASNGYISLFDNFGISPVSLGGTWTSQAVSLAGAGTYLNSTVQWLDVSTDLSQVTNTVQSSIDGGSTYQTLTNGGAIANLTLGQSLSGISVRFKITFLANSSTVLPEMQYLTAYILGGFSSSGTRIAPFLSLSNAAIAGSTLTSWTATTPTNTSVAVSTSLDGVSYSGATNGGAITGITSQPAPTLDTFDSNSSPNYTQTNKSGGALGTWLWDTPNSRLNASGGTDALLIYNGISSASNASIMADLDRSDGGGLVLHYKNSGNSLYYCVINDNLASSNANTVGIYKYDFSGPFLLTSTNISFTRGTYARFIFQYANAVLSISMDGVQIASSDDSTHTPITSGQIGFYNNSGTSRFYNVRMQPQGDTLSGKIVYSKVTLTSTDPTATPQLTDLTVAALHPNIGLGSLIPTADYTNTYLSDNFNDLAKKSDYTQFIDQNLNFIFGSRVAQPAPWILQSADPFLLIDGPVTVDYSADLYRNEMILDGVVATATGSETKIGDGTTTSWTVGGEIVSPPLVYLNNQLKTIGVKGIDTGKDFYYTPGSSAISQDTSGTVLVQTDTLLLQNFTYQFITSITVDNTNLAGTVTQKQFATTMGRTITTLNVLNLASAAHTTSSDAGDLDVSRCRRIAIDINVTAVSGTAPFLQFFIDRKGVDGVYYPIWTSSLIGSTSTISKTLGAFATVHEALGAVVRLRWTITGTTPSFTFSVSVQGILDVQSAGLGIVAVKEDVSSQSLNVAAATAYANTLLSRYGLANPRTITFKTWRRNPSLAIGQYLPVFLPEYGIKDASMLITAIQTTQNIGSESGNPTQIYWQQVTATEAANIGSAWKLLSSTLK